MFDSAVYTLCPTPWCQYHRGGCRPNCLQYDNQLSVNMTTKLSAIWPPNCLQYDNQLSVNMTTKLSAICRPNCLSIWQPKCLQYDNQLSVNMTTKLSAIWPPNCLQYDHQIVCQYDNQSVCQYIYRILKGVPARWPTNCCRPQLFQAYADAANSTKWLGYFVQHYLCPSCSLYAATSSFTFYYLLLYICASSCRSLIF